MMVAELNASNVALAADVLHLLLVRGAGGLNVSGRTHDGIGELGPYIVSDVAPPLLPAYLLAELDNGPRYELTVTQYTSDQVGGRAMVQALVVRWRFERTFAGSQWIVDDTQLEPVRERLRAFALKPAAIIDAGIELIALWRLSNAITLDECARVQERLAAVLRGSMAERQQSQAFGQNTALLNLRDCDPRRTIPFFGIVRELGNVDQQCVEVIGVDLCVEHSIDDIMKAITLEEKHRS